jgi:hypothetical protein
MTSVAKIIEIGSLMARVSHSDEETTHNFFEQELKPLGDSELMLVHFACMILLAEKPYSVNSIGAIDPRHYESAKILGAQVMPGPDHTKIVDDMPGLVYVQFVPRGSDIPARAESKSVTRH